MTHAHLRAWDQGFVAAVPAAVFRLLADPASYPRWWPGASVERNGGSVVLPVRRVGAVRGRPERHRQDEGLFLALAGALRGTLEWYLEPFEDGTIVNCLVEADGAGRGRAAHRRLRRLRIAVRRGLVGLKGELE